MLYWSQGLPKTYYRQLLLLTAVVALIFLSLSIFAPGRLGWHWLWMLPLMATVTTFLLGWMSHGKQRNQQFVNRFMAGTALKMLVLMLLMLAMVIISKSRALSFIITTLALYLIFLVFEIISLLRISRENTLPEAPDRR